MHHPLALYLSRPAPPALTDVAERPRLDRPEPRTAGSTIRMRLAQWLRPGPARGPATEAPVTIRVVRATESPALAELAVMDERRPPQGRVLVAEVDDTLVAALPLADGPPLRHPLRASADALELLEVRRLQLRAGRIAA